MVEPRALKGESSLSDTPRPRPGWACSCGYRNFKKRTNCYKCSADKAEDAAECIIKPEAPRDENFSSDTPRPRPGWVCS